MGSLVLNAQAAALYPSTKSFSHIVGSNGHHSDLQLREYIGTRALYGHRARQQPQATGCIAETDLYINSDYTPILSIICRIS